MYLNKFGEVVEKEWIKIPILRKNILLDEFIVMPNHFHGIIVITDKATQRVAPTSKTLKPNSLGSILGQFKSVVTKQIRNMGLSSYKWQRNYFERIIRDEKELNAVREYIFYNPNKWQWDKLNPEK